MAAEAIQGCRTRPTGMNTPADTTAVTLVTVGHAPLRLPVPAHHYLQRRESPGSCR